VIKVHPVLKLQYIVFCYLIIERDKTLTLSYDSDVNEYDVKVHVEHTLYVYIRC